MLNGQNRALKLKKIRKCDLRHQGYPNRLEPHWALHFHNHHHHHYQQGHLQCYPRVWQPNLHLLKPHHHHHHHHRRHQSEKHPLPQHPIMLQGPLNTQAASLNEAEDYYAHKPISLLS